ncbi:butyrophilin-like protein 1 isoform X2 [Centropristis striata]|uniref:butyrophilin-like protein 1 isoform X2 n=1 Tax=Centropristis striata TaxID=184440 RepID=UPI0027E14A6C|nr:butyrophilin-like protein 1 isoform X2 [Centropristis striata]
MFGVKLQFNSLCLCLVLSGITLGLGQGVISVTEGSEVVLPCSLSTKENIEFKLFDWKKAAQKDQPRKEVFFYDAGDHYNNGREGQSEEFKGRVFFSQDELKQGNASITIRNTKWTDSGNYTCDFPRLQPPQRFQIELIVGAAPKPHVSILDETDDWSLLQCEVRGAFPKPEVEWRGSSGNKLPSVETTTERDGKFYVTLNTTVYKTDKYRCVSTQTTINHQIYSEIHVVISGAAPKPHVSILDETTGWSLLQCEVLGALPKPEVEWRDSSGNKLPSDETTTERDGKFYVTLNTTVDKTDKYRCVSTQTTINHQIYSEIHVVISAKLIWLIGGLFLGSVLSALAVLAGFKRHQIMRICRKKGKFIQRAADL